MKTLIVYSSKTGNTRKVAEAIHAVLPAGTDIFPVSEAPEPDAYDFVVVGYWVVLTAYFSPFTSAMAFSPA